MTSPSERPQNLSEAEFLARQAEQAQQAITHTLQAMQESLKNAADLPAWTRQYPWYAVGAAALTGFAAAAALVPSRGQSVEQRLAELYQQQLATGAGQQQGGQQQQQGPGLWNTLAQTLGDTLKTTLQSAIVAAVTSRTQAQSPSPNGHGDHAPEAH